MNKDKGIAMYENISDDHPVTNELMTEKPNIQKNMVNEGEYTVHYPSFL